MAVSEDSARVVFHGTEYILTLIVAGEESLGVDLEEERTGARWRSDFSARYVEDVTRKTSSFKRFPVFVDMLKSALAGSNEHVYLDLLTVADLEALKARKAAGAGGGGGGSRPGTGASAATSVDASTASASSRSSKRYLILTYAADFDRVHYPLPIAFEEAPSVAGLQARARMAICICACGHMRIRVRRARMAVCICICGHIRIRIRRARMRYAFAHSGMCVSENARIRVHIRVFGRMRI